MSGPVGDETGVDRDGGDGRIGAALAGVSETPWTPAFLATVRADRRLRAGALLVALVVGLAIAWIHWLGLFVAGALLGLASRTVPRAVIAALGFGVVVLAVQVVAAPGMDVGRFLALTPPAYVAVAAALVAPVWGSLVRAVV